MKVGIFGGSFSPVHLGHYAIVREALRRRLVDRIIVVPAYRNPLKADSPALPETLRWRMLERTFAEFDRVEISSFEVKRRELSYTYKTLDHYRSKFPDARLVLLLGSDSHSQLHKWSKPEKILSSAEILVFPRLDRTHGNREKSGTVSGGRGTVVDCRIPSLSSSEIRSAGLEEIRRKPMLHRNAVDIWEAYVAGGNGPHRDLPLPEL